MNIKQIADSKKLSVEALARVMQVSRTHVFDILAGRKRMGHKVAHRLARHTKTLAALNSKGGWEFIAKEW